MTPLFALSDPVLLALIGGGNALGLGLVGVLTLVVTRHFALRDKTDQEARDIARTQREDEREQAKILRDKAVALEVAKVAVEAKKAAAEVILVKETLVESTSVQTARLEDIHTLVNSAMGDQKRLLAVTARAKAVITNEAADIKAADAAEAALADHEAKQKVVDKRYAEGK